MSQLLLHLKKIGELPRDTKLLISIDSVLSLARGYTQVIELIYLSILGLNAAQIGLIVSISAINPIRILFYSIIADKYGKKKVLAFMNIMGAIHFSTYYVTRDFLWFFLATTITGGIVAGNVIEQALLAEKSGDTMRTMAFSVRSFVTTVFSIIGSSLSGFPEYLQKMYNLDVVESIKPLFIIGIILSLIATTMNLFIKEENRKTKKNSLKTKFISKKSQGFILRFSLSSIIMAVGSGVFFNLVSLWFWLTYEVKLSEVGYILAASKIVEAPTFLLGPIIASRLGLVKAYTVTRLIGMVAFSFMPFMPTPVLAAIVFAIRNAIMHVGLPLKTSYTMALLNPEERASSASLINLPSIVPQAVASALGGYLMEYVSTILPIYIAVAAFSSEAIYYNIIFSKIKPPEERSNIMSKKTSPIE